MDAEQPGDFRLVLRPTPDAVDPTGALALRMALKVLLRRFGLKAVTMVTVVPTQQVQDQQQESR